MCHLELCWTELPFSVFEEGKVLEFCSRINMEFATSLSGEYLIITVPMKTSLRHSLTQDTEPCILVTENTMIVAGRAREGLEWQYSRVARYIMILLAIILAETR